MIGYLGLCAMALDAVETLSDEDAKPQAAPVTPVTKAAPKAKNKPKTAPKKDAAPKADLMKKPSLQTTGESKQVVKNVLKRPAASKAKASSKESAPEKVLVSKGLYKNGMYGFKINGSEKLRVTLMLHSISDMCSLELSTATCSFFCSFL